VKLRFLADADLSRYIVTGLRLRQPGVDIMSALGPSLVGAKDPEVLEIAAREGRALISHDFGTMPKHFWDLISRHHSPGVFLIAQTRPIGVAIEELALVWEASEAAEWEDQLTYLPL
jgi:predicted nuclease of predicted toxin-antitoxin system